MVVLRRRGGAKHLAALRALGDDHADHTPPRSRGLKAPPSEQRLAVLNRLAEGEATVEALARDTHLAVEVVDSHLIRLMADGIITAQVVEGEAAFRVTDGVVSQLVEMLCQIYRKQARS